MFAKMMFRTRSRAPPLVRPVWSTLTARVKPIAQRLLSSTAAVGGTKQRLDLAAVARASEQFGRPFYRFDGRDSRLGSDLIRLNVIWCMLLNRFLCRRQ